MKLQDGIALIDFLERHPEKLPLYAKSLEAVIADLMDDTYRSTDATEKARQTVESIPFGF